MNHFKQWCNFEVLHSYYRDGLCHDLDIVPNQNTQTILKQNGIQWHKSGTNTWQLFGPTQVDLANFVSQNPNQELLFDITTADPAFIQFTEYPLDTLGYYEFSNESQQQAGATKINLPKEFKPSSSASAAVAKIKLALNGLTQNAQFQIAFEARKTRWQYFIIPQQSIEGSLILQGQEAHFFTGPESKKIQNGTHAECFDSDTNLLALQEMSKIKLKLATQQTADQNAPPKVLVDHLPTPGPSSLRMAQGEGKDPISTVYIYV